MAGPNSILPKNFTAGAAVGKHKIVKASSGKVVQGAAATDLVFAVSLEAAAADGDRLDCEVIGIALVKAGGTVAFGDYVVSDANGDGVAGTAATAKQRAVGIAMDSAVDNDIFPVLICPSQFDLA